jgi:alpha-2-macroglobulin
MENGADDWLSRWRGGYFEHVEKHDDRVIAFATRLASGRHEFSYLVRATTAGTFDARGATVEAMYAPELVGRSQASTVTVK